MFSIVHILLQFHAAPLGLETLFDGLYNVSWTLHLLLACDYVIEAIVLYESPHLLHYLKLRHQLVPVHFDHVLVRVISRPLSLGASLRNVSIFVVQSDHSIRVDNHEASRARFAWASL